MELRLERPFPGRASGAIDLVLGRGDQFHGIELKYLTRSCQTTFAGEAFNLKQHGAQDIRRYDVCKDVQRMEDFSSNPSSTASVIVLTNDPYYWRTRERSGTCAEAFDIYEARQLCGLLDWAEHTGPGTKKNREQVIALRGSYALRWREYSDLNCLGGHFKYLHVPLRSGPAAG